MAIFNEHYARRCIIICIGSKIPKIEYVYDGITAAAMLYGIAAIYIFKKWLLLVKL